MNPTLLIDTEKVATNTRVVTQLMREHGLKTIGITKDFTCEPPITRALVDNGVDAIGDSRIDNLMKVADLDVEKWLIRMPQVSDVDRVVTYADLSLNTEAATIRALDEACERLGIATHKVLLMCDLGDLREGFVDEAELMDAAALCMELEHIQLAGIGANLTCLSFVQADTAKMEELCGIAERMAERFGIEDMIVSAGNSATLHLLMTEGLPAGVTNLRLGESLLFGRERACYEYLPGTFNDAFILQAEVIEAKRKPSMPWGTIGANSYGETPEFVDEGEQVRALVAAGSQDIDIEVMWPVDERLRIIASSSDHTVIDISNAVEDYPVGSVIELRCGYHAALHAFTSAYVSKQYI